MPLLDPVLHSPLRTGPTRDMHALTAMEPVWREERHVIKPGRLPVSMNANMKARPKARSGSGTPNTGFALARIPVLVRASNQRPQETGEGTDRGVWALSDPSWTHRPSALPSMSGIGTALLPTWITLGLGVAIGIAAYYSAAKRK